jgi:hypothetical protein
MPEQMVNPQLDVLMAAQINSTFTPLRDNWGIAFNVRQEWENDPIHESDPLDFRLSGSYRNDLYRERHPGS